MGRVFISYSHNNKIVKKVNEFLNNNKILTWFDENDIHPNDYWDVHIKTSIIASSVFLMFYSRDYAHSAYCKKEFELASKQSNLKIIVVGLDDEIDSFSQDKDVSAIQRVSYDYKKNTDEELCNILLGVEEIHNCSYTLDNDIIDMSQSVNFLQGMSSYKAPKHSEFLMIYIKLLTYVLSQEKNNMFISSDVNYSSLVFCKTMADNSKVLRFIGANDFVNTFNKDDRDIFLKNILFALFKYSGLAYTKDLKCTLDFNDVFINLNNKVYNKAFEMINNKINILYNDKEFDLEHLIDEFYKIYNACIYLESHKTKTEGNNYYKSYEMNELVIEISRLIYILNQDIKTEKYNFLPDILTEGNEYLFSNNDLSSLELLLSKNINQDCFIYGEIGCGINYIFQDYFINHNNSIYIDLLEASRNNDRELIKRYLTNNIGYGIDYFGLYNWSSYEKTLILLIDNLDYLSDDVRENVIQEIGTIQDSFKIVLFSSKRNVEGKISLDKKDTIFKNYNYSEILPLSKDKAINYLIYRNVNDSVINSLNSLESNDSFFKFFNSLTKLNVLIESIRESNEFSINDFKNMDSSEIKIYQMIFESEKDFSVSKRISKLFKETVVPIDDVIVKLVLDEIKRLKEISYYNELAELSTLRFKELIFSFNILSKNDDEYQFFNNDIKCYFTASFIITKIINDKSFSKVEELLKPFENDYNVLKYLNEFSIFELIDIESLFNTDVEDYLSLKHVLFKIAQYKKVTRQHFSKVANFTTIPDNFFFGAENITNVTIPKTINEIGRAAFSNMTRLKKLILVSDADELIIKPWAILNCENLESIKIGKNYKKFIHPLISRCSYVKEIIIDAENEYFSTLLNNTMLTTKDQKGIYLTLNTDSDEIRIPEGVLYLNKNSLGYLTNTKKIFVPKTAVEIETDFVDFCQQLVRLEVDKENPRYYSDDNGFMYTNGENGKILFRVPTGYRENINLSNDIVTIGNDSISCCTYVKEIIVPKNIKYIENYAFADTLMLEKIIFEDISQVKEFGNYIFLTTNKFLNVIINDDEEDDVCCSVNEFNKIYNRNIVKAYSVDNKDAPIDLDDFIKQDFEVISDSHNFKSYKRVVLLRAINLFDNLFTYNEDDYNILMIGMTEYNTINSKTVVDMKIYIENLIKQKYINMIVFTRDLPMIHQLNEYKDKISIVRTSLGTTKATKKVIEIINNRGSKNDS